MISSKGRSREVPAVVGRVGSEGTRVPFIAFAILLGLLAVAADCSRRGDELPDPKVSYETFLRATVHQMCGKMLVCYRKIYRTASPAIIASITQDRCEKTAFHDFDTVMKYQTTAMKMNSVDCYRTMLRSPCKTFAEVAYWNPSCIALRKETGQAFSEAAKKAPFSLVAGRRSAN